MSTECNTGVVIPTLNQDPCNGNKISTQCIIDYSLYPELGLSTNPTQQEINNALYLAFLNLKNQIENNV